MIRTVFLESGIRKEDAVTETNRENEQRYRDEIYEWHMQSMPKQELNHTFWMSAELAMPYGNWIIFQWINKDAQSKRIECVSEAMTRCPLSCCCCQQISLFFSVLFFSVLCSEWLFGAATLIYFYFFAHLRVKSWSLGNTSIRVNRVTGNRSILFFARHSYCPESFRTVDGIISSDRRLRIGENRKMCMKWLKPFNLEFLFEHWKLQRKWERAIFLN